VLVTLFAYLGAAIHQTRASPAMEAGIADRVWSIEKIVALLKQTG
jgi:hypothetical protein